MKPVPHLADLIVTWMKKELPKAKYEKWDHEGVGNCQFTITKGKGKTRRECFRVEVSALNITEIGLNPYMTISCPTTNLMENAEIKNDRVIFGKWNSGQEVLAADPDFFLKMTLCMTRAAMVVTMGDFYPRIPEKYNVEI